MTDVLFEDPLNSIWEGARQNIDGREDIKVPSVSEQLASFAFV